MKTRNIDRNVDDESSAKTEDIPPSGQHIDKMTVSQALATMLANQRYAVTAVEAALTSIELASVAAYQRLCQSDSGRLIYAGAGTSARIGVQDGVELPPTFNWPFHRIEFLIAGGEAALLRPIENAEDNAETATSNVVALSIGPADVVIGLAASGSTIFTTAALNAAKQAGAVTIGIANNPDTALLAAADYPILLATGGEIIAGSTRLKAGTAQKICLNLISSIIMVKMGFVVDGMMTKMVPTNAKLHRRRNIIEAKLNNL